MRIFPPRAGLFARALLFSGLACLELSPPALANDSAGIPWRDNFERAQAEARALGRPLWVQFTGPWCLYCRRLERDAFVRPDIIATARDAFVAVKVRSDEREDLIARFSITGLPATVVLSADGRFELGRRDGYCDADQFRAFLAASRPAPQLALAGYCPVSLVRGQGLTPGQKQFALNYDGREYRFADAELRDAFRKEPERFLPANGGLCPVRHVEDGRAVAGDPKSGVYYRDRLYLCADEEARQSFASDPQRYCDVDLADRGYCPHCRNQSGRLVRGLPQFSAIHAGRRYLFPDKVHLEAFRASPERFVR